MMHPQKAVLTLTRKMIMPGQTIGIIGGGQLGQMMALSAKYAGFRVAVLDPTPHCPAGQVADQQLVAPYADVDAIERLAAMSDVLTYEFENVDLAALDAVADQVAIPQGTELLRITKNRLREKTFLRYVGMKTAPFVAVSNREDLQAAVAQLGYPCVLKTCEGGYDGHGQIVLHSATDLANPLVDEILATRDDILEGWVDFQLECSVMVARNASGEISVFPVSENIHWNEILHESIVPARISDQTAKRAQQMAEKIAHGLQLRGILGVEMFVTATGEIYINELAPRPHNSGHYSIEACNFSQFAIHDRAICNWPLPKIKLLHQVVMVNVLGQHVEGARRLVATKPNWHFHDYGKAEVRHNRKMGHITILTADVEQTLKEIDDTHVWRDKH